MKDNMSKDELGQLWVSSCRIELKALLEFRFQAKGVSPLKLKLHILPSLLF